MYIDKMIEFIALHNIVYNDTEDVIILGRKYNMKKIYKRMKELQEELLEPYAIKSDSKE